MVSFLKDHTYSCPECEWKINGPPDSHLYCIECGISLNDVGKWYRHLWTTWKGMVTGVYVK